MAKDRDTEPEQYDAFGDIKRPAPRLLSSDQKHMIHQTKDLFEADCYLCQQAMKKHIKTYWTDEY